MNYRHHFHAGNFADVVKHALLLQLIRGMQRKEKGFLYLDTHAGRGGYNLSAASQGDSLARQPEWPAGIGRLWNVDTLPPSLADYVSLVRKFNIDHGADATAAAPGYYPGSPWLARALARPQDRLALCEKHPEECEALRDEMSTGGRVTIQTIDGYTALRAMLPSPERRALVLIDPPFEEQDEFAQIIQGLGEALKRFPSGTYAIWYPLTERARVNAFFEHLQTLRLPPTWVTELAIAGEYYGLKMRGCGLVVINPPWQLDLEIKPWLSILAGRLEQAKGAEAVLTWLVHE